MFRAAKIDTVSCEEQARFVYERLVDTEAKLSKLYSDFSVYLRKSASLRDATDDIALTLNDIASNEKINRSTKKQVLLFSDLLASINDLRENKIQQLQAHTINYLSQYNTICRNAKEQVKTLFNAREKETTKRKQLGKVRNISPFNRERIVKAEAALNSEVSNVSRAQKELEDNAILFEKKKLDDLKGILQEYVSLEIAEHAMAIEFLSQSFNTLDSIDVKSDLHDFEDILKTTPASLKILKINDLERKPSEAKGENAQQHTSTEEVQEKFEYFEEDESETSESTSEETEKNMYSESTK